jgi:tetratricopeptide (TPR) repeat protein
MKDVKQQREQGVTDKVLRTAPPSPVPPNNRQRAQASRQPITPVSLEVPPQHKTPNIARRNTVPIKVAWATIFLLTIIAFGIFHYLPQNLEDKLKPSAAITPPESSDAETRRILLQSSQRTPPANIKPWQETQRLQHKAEAEHALQAFITKHATVEQKGGSNWATEQIETAQSKAAQGDEAFRLNDFTMATQFYTEGVDILDELIAKADAILEASLTAGYKALDAKDATSAISQFQLALAIDPENASANHGLSRANTLDEVLTHLESGYQHEKQGSLTRARADFEQAFALDPEFEETQTALTRVREKITDVEFRQTMSEGFASLNQNKFQVARKAFEKARQLKPQSSEPQDGLAQVTLNRRLQRIAEYRISAETFAREEQWRAAAEAYQAALQLDPTLVFAKQGKANSIARAELSEALDRHIERPDRLSDEQVLKNAVDLHANASSLADQGPRLRQQLAKLAELITMAQTPVRVHLESDNETNVVMYKVGRLGHFTAHDLELRPGIYTIVGTREGYRDVRHTLTVIAGQIPGRVLIRCEDKI